MAEDAAAGAILAELAECRAYGTDSYSYALEAHRWAVELDGEEQDAAR